MLVGAVGASVVQAEEPSDCEPDQRTVPGNASSPCLWDYHLDEITAMRYVVVEHSGNDTCYEALEFGPFNFARDFGANLYLLTAAARPDGQPDTESYYKTARIYDSDLTNHWRHFVASGDGQALWVRHGVPVRSGPFGEWSNEARISPFYGVDTSVGIVSKFIYHDWGAGPFFKLITRKEHGSQQTRWFKLPAEVNDFNSMVNDCIHSIKLRLESEATQEKLRQELAHEEREKQQALDAEKAQAEVDAIRLESAQAQLLLVQERELIKTRALKARLERDKVIIGVIQDIAREKIRGAAERANITHRYLQEIKEQYDTFNAEVQEKYDELQRLEALNQAIVDAIAAHDEAIQANIARAEALERQSQQKIDELIRQEPTPDSTPTPIPAPSVADEIEKLADLLDRGLLTQDEFNAKKKELLGQ